MANFSIFIIPFSMIFDIAVFVENSGLWLEWIRVVEGPISLFVPLLRHGNYMLFSRHWKQ